MAEERGPLDLVRDDELVWLTPRARLPELVGSDLAALTQADDQLRVLALGAAAVGPIDDGGLLGDLSEASWQLGDLDGILSQAALDPIDAAGVRFENELSDRAWDLPPESLPPYDAGTAQPTDRFTIDDGTPAPAPVGAEPPPVYVPPPPALPPPVNVGPTIDVVWFIFNNRTGAGIPGATVSLSPAPPDGASRATDSAGNALVRLPAGTYQLHVEAPGFNAYEAPYGLTFSHTERIDLTPGA